MSSSLHSLHWPIPGIAYLGLLLITSCNAIVDLTGGYYNAGDNVKFNFPMAYTTTMLS
ncbi:hypothetical protein LguiB_013064 [Lonicera macranthoides]